MGMGGRRGGGGEGEEREGVWGYRGVLERKIFQTGVTRSMTYVAMTVGNHRRSDDDVINNSLLRAWSIAHDSPHDNIDMKAGRWGDGGREERKDIPSTN